MSRNHMISAVSSSSSDSGSRSTAAVTKPTIAVSYLLKASNKQNNRSLSNSNIHSGCALSPSCSLHHMLLHDDGKTTTTIQTMATT